MFHTKRIFLMLLKCSCQRRLDAATSFPPALAELERSSLAGGIEKSESAIAQIGQADPDPGNHSSGQALSLRQLSGMLSLIIIVSSITILLVPFSRDVQAA